MFICIGGTFINVNEISTIKIENTSVPTSIAIDECQVIINLKDNSQLGFLIHEEPAVVEEKIREMLTNLIDCDCEIFE